MTYYHQAMDKWHKIEHQMHKVAEHKKKVKKQSSRLQHSFRGRVHKFFHDLLHHRLFELGVGLLVIVNLVLVIIETDIVAKHEKLPTWCDFAGWIILIAFVLELGMRLYVSHFEFFFDETNAIDFLLVITDLIFNIIGVLAGELFPVSFLRIVRLCKLSRVAKAFHVFPELRLMMAGLIGSLKAIFWGTLLLVFGLLAFSIVAVQFIHPLNENITDKGVYKDADCDRCPRAYSSVAHATLTICQQIVAGDSWGLTNITVIEHYPATAIYFAVVFLAVDMAILNLILGMVVDVASQARDRLKQELEDEKLMGRLEVHSHLLEICKNMDTDESGEISRGELFSGYYEQEDFRDALSYIDVTEDDLAVLWTILDVDKSGSVSYHEFVSNCYKLKCSDTHFVLAYIKYYITVIKDQLSKQMDDVAKNLDEEINTEVKLIQPILAASEDTGEIPVVEGSATDTKLSKTALKTAPQATDDMEKMFQEFVTRIKSEFNKLTDSIRKSSAIASEATEMRKEGDDDKFDKLASSSSPGNQQSKLLEKDLVGSQGNELYWDLLQTSNRQQKELITTMEEIKNKLDRPAAPSTMPLHLPTPLDEEIWPVPRASAADPWPVPPNCCYTRPDTRGLARMPGAPQTPLRPPIPLQAV